MFSPQQAIIIFLVTAIVFTSLGFAIAEIFGVEKFFSVSKTVSLSQKENTFEAGWEAARKKIIDSGLMPPMLDVSFLNGSVKKINTDSFQMETNLISPLDDEIYKKRLVKFNNNTEIIIIRQFSEEERNKKIKENLVERKVWEEKLKGVNNEMEKMKIEMQIMQLIEPVISQEIKGEISDLKVGDNIVVKATENITYKKEFVAKKIVIDEVVIPEMMPAEVPINGMVPSPY